jgi:predicted ferric reductase
MSSSPYDNHVNFHIKAIGDWTEEAMKTVQESLLESGTPEGDAHFSVRVDGPIGASFQDFKDHPVCVLIGAGIGCTVRASNCAQMSASMFLQITHYPNSFFPLYSLTAPHKRAPDAVD